MEKRQKKASKHYLKQAFLGILDAFLITAAAVVVFLAWLYYSATPAADQLVKRKIAQTSTIYDKSGEHILYTLYGEENRKIISHGEIPDIVRNATIAAEDSNFYHHIGIDPLAMARALRVNISNNGIRQGASTITQQLARSAFLTREQTIQRKILEVVFALKIEKNYTKDQILDQYLNEVPYGANAYGVEVASQTYFGKPAKDLTLDEAAFLAALPKAPSFYSPYGVHRNELKLRQADILSHMIQLNLVSYRDAKKSMEIDTLAKIKPLSKAIAAPHFVFYVLGQLEEKYGTDLLQTGGLSIFTSLDWNMQKEAEKSVAVGAQKNNVRGASNAALIAIDPKNGDVLAMVGSKDYFDSSIDGQVNVTTSLRQPGSSFKPFAYAHAFEIGYQPETRILDAKTNFGPDGSGKDYVPGNYDGKFHGLLTMRETLAQSLNVPAVKTLYLASVDGTIELAHRMGITTLNERNRYGLSLVLGGGEVRLLDMASAFGVFATDGIRNPIRPVVKIVGKFGTVIYQAGIDSRQALDQQVARKINSILSDNKARTPIFGSRSALMLDDGRAVAAKTGTTQEFRDAWTIGYTPSLVVGVWAGNNDNSPMKSGSDGVFVAAPIWKDYMQRILGSTPKENFIAYDPQSGGVVDQAQEMLAVITYYNEKSGKKISAEKASKTDQSKVRQKIEYIPATAAQGKASKNSFSIAMPSPSDPMYVRWATGQLEKEEKKEN
ncbi:MAG: penicillin-binding protein [Candidatus Moranbacteria bacterium]|nr:penicillin-binding protein [Candidatus Moranbacteria bacterium]